jgi:Ser/Thr protein kinase RdoA (MazF antagonist)
VSHETPLTGGRVTKGVVRIGETVRRPFKPSSPFVRQLLVKLEETGFEAAPRYLGSDHAGRESFSFLPGDVPAELDASFDDETLATAARLIRRYHDATAGTELAGEHEVVCHNDLSPCNFVFREGTPVAIIDFDAAAPGERLRDIGYAAFLWLNLGTDGPPLREQVRRLNVFCRAYDVEPSSLVVDAIVAAVAANAEQLRLDARSADAIWWQEQHEWLRDRRDALARAS